MRVVRQVMFAVLIALAPAPSFGQAIGDAAPAFGELRIQGVKINVSDTARSERFYTEIIGLRALRTIERDGNVDSIILGHSDAGAVGGDPWLVLKNGPPMVPNFPLVLLNAPDTEALAVRAEQAGHAVRRSPVGIVLITDPDGYLIEVLRRGAQSEAR